MHWLKSLLRFTRKTNSDASARSLDTRYVVVLLSQLKNVKDNSYYRMSQAMAERVSRQPGFMGMESVRGEDGRGITLSYWNSLEAIQLWKSNSAHQEAQRLGKSEWYESYEIRTLKIDQIKGQLTGP